MPVDRRLARFALAVMVCLTGGIALPAAAERVTLTTGWAFHRGDVAGAQADGFDDASWRRVAAPHDWSIEDRADGTPPFDRATPGGADSGYLPGGVGWYRRTLTLDAQAAAGTTLLTFEAAYMDAQVWLNGQSVATHHYGYTAFTIDLTGKLRAGRNVIAIRLDHADPSSRWYAGSGLIRPVYLDTYGAAYLDRSGTVVTTPVADAARGVVRVRTLAINRARSPAAATLDTRIVDAAGRVVARDTRPARIAAGAKAELNQTFTLDRPALWSPDAPNLYRLEQSLRVGDRVVDTRDMAFGVRTVTVDAVHGLRINGTRVLLRGGNLHHDNYMLGAAGWPAADARKVSLMKAAGYNAIRSAHNPASQATLDAADRLGMLVIDEAFDAWSRPKRVQDYARFFADDWRGDIRSMVTRARNHPSVVMWSIGNEILEQGEPVGQREARELAALVRGLDPTRPVTQGVNLDGAAAEPLFAALDVAGYNYRPHLYAADHARYPGRVMFGSESYSADAYDYWRPTATMPWVIGDFVWTAIDYLGEAGIGWSGYTKDWGKIGPYPWHLAYSGEIDATGRRLPASYYREIVWGTGDHPVAAFVRWPGVAGSLPDRDIHTDGHREWVMPDLHESWSWPGHEGKPLEVVVYSALPEVELLLNGRSLGRQAVGEKYRTRFTIPYAPGTLVARGYRDGRSVAEWTLRTAGAPAAIRLSVDRPRLRADAADVAYVTAQLVDAVGRPVYAGQDDRALTVAVSGAATLAGVGSGNPVGTESFQSGKRTSFHGRLVAVVRASETPGAATVRVSAPGLPDASATISTAR